MSISANDFANRILPSRGGDWKRVVQVREIAIIPGSSPRGEVTGNDCLHRLKSVRARSSPRGEVTGNLVALASLTASVVILPSRGGDWKQLTINSREQPRVDPPLAGR